MSESPSPRRVLRSVSSRGRHPFVALVDTNYEPKLILFRHSVQLIVASPPKGIGPKWTKQAVLGSSADPSISQLQLYSDYGRTRSSKLLLTGMFLYSSDLSFKLLSESTSYFDYNPRQIRSSVHSGDNIVRLLFGSAPTSLIRFFKISSRDNHQRDKISLITAR